MLSVLILYFARTASIAPSADARLLLSAAAPLFLITSISLTVIVPVGLRPMTISAAFMAACVSGPIFPSTPNLGNSNPASTRACCIAVASSPGCSLSAGGSASGSVAAGLGVVVVAAAVLGDFVLGAASLPNPKLLKVEKSSSLRISIYCRNCVELI